MNLVKLAPGELRDTRQLERRRQTLTSACSKTRWEKFLFTEQKTSRRRQRRVEKESGRESSRTSPEKKNLTISKGPVRILSDDHLTSLRTPVYEILLNFIT
ncbi:hypothetical protein GJAV_G00213320 [Gymnothorax javanicus]|nr:hypothetical protein GJAV_G00213320 [Gymnothorax javanicus]